MVCYRPNAADRGQNERLLEPEAYSFTVQLPAVLRTPQELLLMTRPVLRALFQPSDRATSANVSRSFAEGDVSV